MADLGMVIVGAGEAGARAAVELRTEDQEGRLWFFESETKEVHDLHLLQKHDPVNGDTWVNLLGHWPTFGKLQKAHFHPRQTPDRKWIIGDL
jgi:hypothetical protein